VVEDGRSGLLFAPGDARALAGKLDLLLRRPELARRLSVGARERARSAFSLDSMVTEVEAVYREAMSGQVCESDVAQPPRPTTGGRLSPTGRRGGLRT
jgi:glycosyltransferase involved in cell wall biosynthesis